MLSTIGSRPSRRRVALLVSFVVVLTACAQRRCAGFRSVGDFLAFVDGPGGGDILEILSWDAPLEMGGGGLYGVLNGTSSLWLSDGLTPWGVIDLSPRPSVPGASIQDGTTFGVNTVEPKQTPDGGWQVVIGSTQGPLVADLRDGSFHGYEPPQQRPLTGLPSDNRNVTAILPLADGTIVFGLGTTSGVPSPMLARFDGQSVNELPEIRSTGFGRCRDLADATGAGTTLVAGLDGQGVARSTDAGRTWAASSNGLPAGTTITRFVRTSSSNLLASAVSAVYRSTDAGASWARTTSGLPSGPVAIARGADRVWAAVGSTFSVNVYRASDDAASAWQQVGTVTAPGISLRDLAAGAAGLFVGTTRGIHRSTDGGGTFTPFNAGLTNGIVYALSAEGASVLAGSGSASGLHRSTNGGASWSEVGSTLAGKTIRSLARSGNVVLAGGENGTFRSTDSGATWTQVNVFPSGSGFASTIVASGNGFLAGLGNGVYRSTDQGATFQPSSTGLPPSTSVSSLAVSGGTVLLGTGDRTYRSVDGGATWSAGGSPCSATPFVTYSLAISGGTAFAGCYGFGVPDTHGLGRSTDGGLTWTRVSNGIPYNRSVWALAAAPNGTIYAGTAVGLVVSRDGGASFTPFSRALGSTAVFALAVTDTALFVGTGGRSVVTYPLPERIDRLVPIVLDVDNGSTRFTTELTLTNRGTSPVSLRLRYTAAASLGSGSGTVTETLSAGQQLVLPNAISWLRQKGLAIPGTGAQGGTLLVSFEGLSAPNVCSVLARTTAATTAPQPAGSAGLAYSGIDPDLDGVTTSLTLFGLRATDSDRTNVAVFNAGETPVTLKVTAVESGGVRSVTVAEADTLPAYGWKQYTGILAAAGIANGWVTVERVSEAGRFSAYGVINDNGTNDGSFVPPVSGVYLASYLAVPALVEAGSFRTELVLANASPAPATLTLGFSDSLGGGSSGSFSMPLAAMSQQIIPDAVQLLRERGIPLPARGASIAGGLTIRVAGSLPGLVYAGGRIAAQSPASGQFGLFVPASLPGSEGANEAFLYGLRADDVARSNVALFHTGLSSSGDLTLEVRVYDGDAGGTPRGAASTITLSPGQWTQLNGVVGAAGVRNGWVRVGRTAGSAPWVAYGVVNDGGGPGERTSDGAFVPMQR